MAEPANNQPIDALSPYYSPDIMHDNADRECIDYDKKICDARQREFKRLNGISYLDHAGTTLYSEKQLSSYTEDLSSTVYGNPHSGNPSSEISQDIVEQTRYQVLSWFNTTPADYHVVFTSGCTSSLKLLAECFDFAPVNNELGHKKSMVAKLSEEEKKCRTTEQKSVDKQLPNEECHFVYLNDNHTSVVGMREVVASRGFGTSHLSIVDVQKRLDQKHKVGGEKAGVMRERHSNKLFTYPAQSNFDGFKYPLAWIENIERGFLSCYGDWYVALDAASYISTSPLDLSFRKPSFVTLSFYKMFGLPTGLGALLIRNGCEVLLKKNYFGGGTVQASLSTSRFHVLKENVSQRFEDGTVSFLDIAALRHGFDAITRITGGMHHVRRHTFWLAKTLRDFLITARHYNGQPVAELYHKSKFESADTQGPIVNFNLLKSDGGYVGYAQVARLAEAHGIHLRTGCFCNMGACQQYLGLTAEKVKANLQVGHVCGDNMDLIDGQPTGSVRVSLGYSSNLQDVLCLIRLVEECFLELTPEQPSHHLTEVPRLDERESVPSGSSAAAEAVQDSRQDPGPRLKHIFLYPVKSCGNFQVERWPLGRSGLLHDRSWMVVEESGRCLTQKLRAVGLCHVQPVVDIKHGRLHLTRSGVEDCIVPLDLDPDNSLQQFRVCEDRVTAHHCGNEVATWLQLALNRPGLQLARQSNKQDRTHIQGGESLSLANTAQFLMVNMASVRQLHVNLRSQDSGVEQENTKPISLDSLLHRFRANLVIDGIPAFSEDEIDKLSIGQEEFQVVGRCSRCQVICVDQQTGQRRTEPLKQLRNRKNTFGVLLRHTGSRHQSEDGPAVLQCGDPVTIISQKSVHS